MISSIVAQHRAFVDRLASPLLTVPEVAYVLGVCETTVRRRANAGLIRHMRYPADPLEKGHRRLLWRDVETAVLAGHFLPKVPPEALDQQAIPTEKGDTIAD